MGAIYVATLGDSSQELYLTIATVALIGLSLTLERVFPLHHEWNRGRGDVLGDVGSLVFVFGIVDGALKWLSPFVILALLPEATVVSGLPLWLEIFAAALLIELGAWLSHWAHHSFKPLWSLHAMHHSADRLYTVNNFRFHPINHIINYLFMFAPVFALGISGKAILGYTGLTMPVLLFQHSNVRFDFGLIKYLFNTNELHRWHHSAVVEEGMHNFGRALVIWDHLFDTFYYPASGAEPRAIGLASSESTYPRANRAMRQLLWPWSSECCP